MPQQERCSVANTSQESLTEGCLAFNSYSEGCPVLPIGLTRLKLGLRSHNYYWNSVTPQSLVVGAL